jgi:hypothetical protein
MGGRGSGRWGGPSSRQHTEDAMQIRVREVVRTVPVWLGQRTTGHQMASRHGPMDVVVDATACPVTAPLVKWRLEDRARVPGEAGCGGREWQTTEPPRPAA